MSTKSAKTGKDRLSQILPAVIGGLFTIAAVIIAYLLSRNPITQSSQGLPSSLPDSGIVMELIPAGDFPMGTSASEIDRLVANHSGWKREWFRGETPQRRVFLKSFFIDKYEITNEQYERFLRAHPGHQLPPYWNDTNFGQPRQPVVGLDWNDATAYCSWLAEKTGKAYRLPTEAQWERAARGNDTRIFPWGEDDPDLRKANFQNQVGKPLPAGSLPVGTSKSGLFEMAGNAAEWCSDWYDETYYRTATNIGPQGSLVGHEKIVRGGSWQDGAFFLRCAARMKYDPSLRKETIGFRVVMLP